MKRPFEEFEILKSVSSPAGSVPATGFLKQSGIHMDSKGFITVNKVVWNSDSKYFTSKCN